jgi:hypothetical protein
MVKRKGVYLHGQADEVLLMTTACARPSKSASIERNAQGSRTEEATPESREDQRDLQPTCTSYLKYKRFVKYAGMLLACAKLGVKARAQSLTHLISCVYMQSINNKL